MSLPTYPYYKRDQSYPAREIPEHWADTKVKHVCRFSTGWTPPTGDASSYEGDNLWANISDLGARVIFDTSKRISDEAVKKAAMPLSPQGSLLFSFKLSIGQVSFAGQDMYTNEAIATFQDSDELLMAYAYYAFPKFLVENAAENIYGAKLLNQELIRSAPILLPPINEQAAIAAFLDSEAGKIDALIAEQEKLLELLAEKRQATISHAVTRGLNPDVPMKDSGVEWLGAVPQHWVKTPIKHIVHAIIDSEHKTTPFYEDGPYMVVRTSNIKSGELVLDDAKYTDVDGYVEWTVRGKPEPGDIIFTREAPAGEACIVPAEFPVCLGQRTVLMKTDKEKLNSRYGLWSIYGGLASEFVSVLAQGSTVSHFNMSDIGNIPILLPPLKEQESIVSFINVELSKLNSLKVEANRAIDLLKERRAALITAAVTGKIDVREHPSALAEAA